MWFVWLWVTVGLMFAVGLALFISHDRALHWRHVVLIVLTVLAWPVPALYLWESYREATR